MLGLTQDVSLSFVGQVRTRFVYSTKVVWSCSSNSESEERLRGGASRYSKRDGRPT